MWPEHQQTEKLLRRAEQGEEAAVEELLDTHRDSLRRMIQMRMDPRLQRRVDVSDIIQEVLVEASRRMRDYLAAPSMDFRLWLRQIARDRIIDTHRRHRVSAKRSLDREVPVSVSGETASSVNLLAQIRDVELTPAAAALQREMVTLVEQAIADMDEQDREVLLMRHYENFSNQEVAAALKLSEPAASMRYLRAIRRLREALDGSAGGR